MRLAALLAWVTNAAGSDSADAILAQIRDNLDDVTNTSNRLVVEPLGQPLVARQLSAGAATANTALTTTCRRISMRAVGANIRYNIAAVATTANADTSHYIAQDERLDLLVPENANIAVIRDATTNGVLELTELS